MDRGLLIRELASELGVTEDTVINWEVRGRKPVGRSIWRKMFTYFRFHYPDFMKHYHQRSNAESGFFMIKKKFGEFVSSKNDIAQKNEILIKVLCHNLCCLIQEIFLQSIEVDFLTCKNKFKGGA